MKQWNIEICDVTLRDGEQTPGVTFTCEEKMDIANLLDAVGVEIIEAGFPVVSENERECVTAIANMGLDARVCCLARALKPDIDAALDCGVDLVSIFIATSDLHIRHKYRKTREELVDDAVAMVEYALDHGVQVRFAAEDASRTDIAVLKDYYRRGEEVGATYLSFADTVGCLLPFEVEQIVTELVKDLHNPLCMHCHNDLGCATANTVTAGAFGAFQLHTTANGIGERAGNAPLEEVAVALRLKGGVEKYNLSHLMELSRLVEKYSGMEIARNKAIVGEHAFAHESGIHIAAILEDPLTYEFIPPELVGGRRHFILGKHSGMRALRHIVEKLDCSLTDSQMDWALREIKRRSERKCDITQEMLLAIIRASQEERAG